MPGQISRVVASLILHGLSARVPTAVPLGAVQQLLGQGDADGVPLEPYRALLQAGFDADAGLSLLQAGETLRSLNHPLLFVLLNSDTPTLVIEKEARLAAFLHSRHRVVISGSSPTHLLLEHRSEQDAAPEPTENLAACSQHIVLLEETGCQELRLRFPKSREPESWVYEDKRYGAPPVGGGYQQWHFEWSRYEPTRKPMPGLDELLLASAKETALQETQTLASRIENVVKRDLGRTWKVAEVADAFGMSPRSLQRSLGAAGERYSDLLDRIRNREAERLLGSSELSLTEIGYVCGFADSAHFSRSFKKRYGCAPSELRRKG